MGSHEIRVMLGVTRQRVNQLVNQKGFPDPVARLAQGQVWRRRDVERWAQQAGRVIHDAP